MSRRKQQPPNDVRQQPETEPQPDSPAEGRESLTKWSFLLPEGLATKVQYLADLRGVKLSKVIRDILEQNVDRLIKAARTGEELYETNVSSSGLLLVKV